MTDNRKALSILTLSVGDDFLLDIEDCLRAKEAWEILCEIHTTASPNHGLQALKEMVNTVEDTPALPTRQVYRKIQNACENSEY